MNHRSLKSLSSILLTCLMVPQAWAQSPTEGDSPIKFTGDFRYRQEQGPVTPDEGERVRTRHRMRARVKLEAKVNEQATVGVRLVTGGLDEVRSTNETLGDDNAYDPVQFDLAYFTWNYQEDLLLTGGKIANPFYRPGKHQLVWDSDVTLEGMTFVYKKKPGDEGLFARLGAFYIRENKAGIDQGLFSWQLGYGMGLGSGSLKLALAQYHFDLFDGAKYMAGDSAGNSTGPGGTYTASYNPYELSFGLDQQLGSVPLSFYGAYIFNSHTTEENQGYLVGFEAKTSEESPLSFEYNYRNLQADATVGAFTESDFAGGNTNSRGSTFGLAYDLAQNTTLGLSYYLFETAINTGSPVEGDLYQLDFALKF